MHVKLSHSEQQMRLDGWNNLFGKDGEWDKGIEQCEYLALTRNDALSFFYLANAMAQKEHFEKELEYLVSAATLEYSPALYRLGRCFWYGTNVEKDKDRALKNIYRSAELGNFLAKRWVLTYEWKKLKKISFLRFRYLMLINSIQAMREHWRDENSHKVWE